MNTTQLQALAPKAAPAIATSTVLILGRIWNANGAEHSTGNAALMTTLAIGTAGAGFAASVGRAGNETIAGTAFATCGALTLAGVSGYADGWSLPLLLTAVATAVAYGLAGRYWRRETRERVSYEREMTAQRETHAHVERVEALRAGAQIEVARTGAAYAEQLASALISRAALPGYDPAQLAATGLPQLPTARLTEEH